MAKQSSDRFRVGVVPMCRCYPSEMVHTMNEVIPTRLLNWEAYQWSAAKLWWLRTHGGRSAQYEIPNRVGCVSDEKALKLVNLTVYQAAALMSSWKQAHQPLEYPVLFDEIAYQA